ncbi:hypothetical protein FOTG_17094 [Fusarium oxysporum f. sp. vasinfectum 25433]|uniref:Uncharacterized protein n=1 Tax=Fusarium oxysporum f. sp. vasinfectum 25433 TaxID=1089449 RepID=X0L0Q5_FUSOX|nr:hypothetical protein FOTG_17094 [Fusarium oxysporum f. sp. vasinfectum 25433]
MASDPPFHFATTLVMQHRLVHHLRGAGPRLFRRVRGFC